MQREILWHRVAAVLLAALGFIILVARRQEVRIAWTNIGLLHPGASFEEQVAGLLTLGILGAILVAVVRLLTKDRK